MEKEEQIKTFAKALKHQVGLALSENECYQLIKLVWNTAEKEALKPDSLPKTLQKCYYMHITGCTLDHCVCKSKV